MLLHDAEKQQPGILMQWIFLTQPTPHHGVGCVRNIHCIKISGCYFFGVGGWQASWGDGLCSWAGWLVLVWSSKPFKKNVSMKRLEFQTIGWCVVCVCVCANGGLLFSGRCSLETTEKMLHAFLQSLPYWWLHFLFLLFLSVTSSVDRYTEMTLYPCTTSSYTECMQHKGALFNMYFGNDGIALLFVIGRNTKVDRCKGSDWDISSSDSIQCCCDIHCSSRWQSHGACCLYRCHVWLHGCCGGCG